MRRLAWVALLAAAPAGCIDNDHHITVQNCGNPTIIVDVQKEYGPWSVRRDDHERVGVYAFSSWKGSYTSQLRKIKVVVTREADGILLYSNSFHESDFGDYNNHIVIPVYP
jgi:hypothetical protein